MSNIKLEVESGKETIDDQEATKSRCHTNRVKEEQIPTRIEKPIRDTARTRRHRHHDRKHHKHDPSKSASGVTKAINKPIKSRISSPTRALMTKRQELVENGDDKQRIGYAEICKTIKKKERKDIRKYNQEIIRETIMASKNLKKVRRKQKLAQDRLITLLEISRVEKSIIKINHRKNRGILHRAMQ